MVPGDYRGMEGARGSRTMNQKVLATLGVGRQEHSLALNELEAKFFLASEEALVQPGRGRSTRVTFQGHGCHCVLGAWVLHEDESLLQKDQFGMYALYSKNKPKSDSLLASHGNTFFKVSSTASIRIAQCIWSLICLSKANFPA